MKLTRITGVALIALALPLASCSTIKTITGITVNQKSVAVAVQAFDAVQISATNYLKLPTCTAGQSTIKDACKDAKVVPVLVKDVKAGRAARDSLWTASKGTADGIGIRAAYDAVIAATTAIKSDLSK